MKLSIWKEVSDSYSSLKESIKSSLEDLSKSNNEEIIQDNELPQSMVKDGFTKDADDIPKLQKEIVKQEEREGTDNVSNKFLLAYRVTMKFEGGWANHSSDRGKQTWRGISYASWPKWPGWSIIKRIIGNMFDVVDPDRSTKSRINTMLGDTSELQDMVIEFYKKNFWDVYNADYLPDRIGRKLFDTGVNMMTHRSAVFLQKAINDYLPPTEQIKVDGKIGNKTLNALNDLFYKGVTEEEIIKSYSLYQAQTYRSIVQNNPSQQVFLEGWLRRAAYDGGLD